MFQQLLESEPTSQLKQLLESKTTFLVFLNAIEGARRDERSKFDREKAAAPPAHPALPLARNAR